MSDQMARGGQKKLAGRCPNGPDRRLNATRHASAAQSFAWRRPVRLPIPERRLHTNQSEWLFFWRSGRASGGAAVSVAEAGQRRRSSRLSTLPLALRGKSSSISKSAGIL